MIVRADPCRIVAHVTRCAFARPDRSQTHMIDPQLGASLALPAALVQFGYDARFAAEFIRVVSGYEHREERFTTEDTEDTEDRGVTSGSASPSPYPLQSSVSSVTSVVNALAENRDQPGRVLAVHRNRLVVATADGEFSAALDTHLLQTDPIERPAVGDWVVLRTAADGATRVRALLPRRTAFIRGAAGQKVAPQVVAANVDYVLIVTALPGDFNERRLERYLALAWESGAMPIIVLTKCDLVPDTAEFVSAVRALAPGVDVISVSATTDEGVLQLQSLVSPGATIALLGSSGVGKSTLLNRLAGESVMRTADVDVDGRGRHTTTHRELRRLGNGMLVIDTPGMRELQLWSADAGLDRVFEDIFELSLSCRFADCAHGTEPGCAVTKAVANGVLDEERLTSWRKLMRESARARLEGDAVAASAERAKLRAMMRSVREVYRLKPK
jgi:ribosome biogenesis GTPase